MKKLLLFITVLSAAFLFASCGTEELRYNVSSVEIPYDGHPIDPAYSLTHSEINELLDDLSNIDFSQLEIMEHPLLPAGGSYTINIKAASGN